MPRDDARRHTRDPRPPPRRALEGRVGAPRGADAAGLFVCGMGGSAIGGDLAAAGARRPRRPSPLRPIRGYELPSWATPEWTVLCSSYSGNTEETIACFAAAEALGRAPPRRQHRRRADRAGPRRRGAGDRPAGHPAAAGRGRLHVRGRAARSRPWPEAAPRINTEIDGGRRLTSRNPARASSSAPRRSPGGSRARSRWSTGPTLTAPVARRWKTQVNENAKLPAFFSELPEADHNEIAGWDGAPERERAARRRLPRGRRPAPARAPPLRADREVDRRAPSSRWSASRPRATRRTAASALGGDARRPRLAAAWRRPGGSTRCRSTRSKTSRTSWGGPEARLGRRRFAAPTRPSPPSPPPRRASRAGRRRSSARRSPSASAPSPADRAAAAGRQPPAHPGPEEERDQHREGRRAARAPRRPG